MNHNWLIRHAVWTLSLKGNVRKKKTLARQTCINYKRSTTCRKSSPKSILNVIKKIKHKWQYWSDAWHILCVFLGDSSGDILISLETFKCQDSFLSAPFGMMLLWLGRWQLYQLCIRWECVEGIYANQAHPMDGSEINENAHFKVASSGKFPPVCEQPLR